MFLNKKKNPTEKIELTESGFRVLSDEEITQFQWSEIEKLIGFKVDRLSVDDICLKIESINKIAFVTEEFEGWRELMNSLFFVFPQIGKNWEKVIATPAFERKETELFNRNKTLGNNI